MGELPPCPKVVSSSQTAPRNEGLAAWATTPAELTRVVWCKLGAWAPVVIFGFGFCLHAFALAAIAATLDRYHAEAEMQQRLQAMEHKHEDQLKKVANKELGNKAVVTFYASQITPWQPPPEPIDT